MRKLVWIAVGFAAGVGAGIYALQGPYLLALALGMLAAAFLLLFAGRANRSCVLAGWIALGCFLGIGCLKLHDTLRLEPLRAQDGVQLQTVIEVTEYSQASDYGTKGTGKISLGNRSCKVDFYLNTWEQLKPGDRVWGTFRLEFTGPGGADPDVYRQSDGTFLVAYAKGSTELDQAAQIPSSYFHVQLRHRIQEILEDLFPGDTGGFAAALLLGDSDGLSWEDSSAFTVSGLRHMIAVSGMHVAFLFSVLFLLFGKHRLLLPLIGFPTLVVFALLTGCTPSVLRACLMQGLMLLALLLNREYDPPSALAFSVLVILGANPLAFSSVSFQLSVCCVMGIFLFANRIRDWFVRTFSLQGNTLWKGFLRTLAQMASVTLSANVLVTPLCALYFGRVSLVGIFANLAVLWVVSFVFCGVMLVSVLGFFWPAMGASLAWVISYPMRYVLITARLFARIPYGDVSASDPYVVLWLIFTYGLIGAFLLLKDKRPVVLVGCMAVSLVFSLALSSSERKSSCFQMTVLDVGQGQCILFQAGDGVYVADCGSKSKDAAALAVEALRSYGITEIDGLILSHFDRDHSGNAQSLLDRFSVKQVYLPKNADPEDVSITLSEERITWVDETVTLTWSGGSCTIYPEDAGTESCMCILFQTEKCDILIEGDRYTEGEWELLQTQDLPQVDILVAGHHGAKNSTGEKLLKTLCPKLAVISVGKENGYGHPNRETLLRLRHLGIGVWRTDLHGTIVIRG